MQGLTKDFFGGKNATIIDIDAEIAEGDLEEEKKLKTE